MNTTYKRFLIRAASKVYSLTMRKYQIMEPRKILVHGRMGIGDLVMFSPVLAALRKGFPNARITYLTWPDDQGVDLVSLFGWADEVVISGLSRKELGALGRDFDLFVAEAHFPSIKLLPLIAKIPMRAGIVSGGGFVFDHDGAFNLPVACRRDEHTLERNVRLLDVLGMDHPQWPLEDVLNWKERAAVGIQREGVALQPISGLRVPARRWPMENFVELANSLHERGVNSITAFTDDRNAKQLDKFPGFVELVIGQPIEAVAKRIANIRLMIGVDSGLMHLGALLGTPTLTLFGPTDDRLVRPWGDHAEIIIAPCEERPCYRFMHIDRSDQCKTKECMSRIKVEEVLSHALSMIERSEEQPGDYRGV